MALVPFNGRKHCGPALHNGEICTLQKEEKRRNLSRKNYCEVSVIRNEMGFMRSKRVRAAKKAVRLPTPSAEMSPLPRFAGCG